MKTAISIPDATFAEAERFADLLGLNRSQFISRAIEHYLHDLKRHDLTARIDAALAAEGQEVEIESAEVLADNHRRLFDDGDPW